MMPTLPYVGPTLAGYLGCIIANGWLRLKIYEESIQSKTAWTKHPNIPFSLILENKILQTDISMSFFPIWSSLFHFVLLQWPIKRFFKNLWLSSHTFVLIQRTKGLFSGSLVLRQVIVTVETEPALTANQGIDGWFLISEDVGHILSVNYQRNLVIFTFL